jgi:endonuclease/exonuclease/phosphatase family metal-dependent hydrolase
MVVSLVTWNMLAPCFAAPSKYPWASRMDLDWASRRAKIVDRLAVIDADVGPSAPPGDDLRVWRAVPQSRARSPDLALPFAVLLQEVEVALWSDLLGQLQRLGYDGLLQVRCLSVYFSLRGPTACDVRVAVRLQETSRGHPVANAVCVRRGTVEVVRAESRSRALITVLRACGDSRLTSRTAPPSLPPSPSTPLYLANVHLEAGAEKGAQRLAQLRSLLRRIEFQRAIDVADRQGRPQVLSPGDDAGGVSTPVVVAGDFNFDRSSELHAYLSTGTPPAADHGRRRQARGHSLLPLSDAYLETPPPWGPALRSSYRNGRLLDFVWTSSAVSVLRTMPVCELAGSSQPHQLPSAAQPSDHLPIGALLTWPGAPPPAVAPSSGGRRPAWQQRFVENVQRRR